MTKDERAAYQLELRGAAKRLGLSSRGDIEARIVQHLTERVRGWMGAHGQPDNLGDLLELVATSLDLEIVEIHSDDDLDALLERIPPTREPVFAVLATELDDRTDAIVLQRQHRADPSEMPYLAVVNCKGWHRFRSYFSKWHEIVHLLLDGAQLRFAFRTTPIEHKHPEEVLVDKIAGVLAFHPDIFEPVLSKEIARAGRLTFDVVDKVRQQVAPDASRHSTLLACIRHCSQPVCLFKVVLGLKKREERQLFDLLAGLNEEKVPTEKPRVREPSASPALRRLGIRLHSNMEVPRASVVMSMFETPTSPSCDGRERLEIWRTSSSGPVGRGPAHVEARRFGEQLWCLLTCLPGVRDAGACRVLSS